MGLDATAHPAQQMLPRSCPQVRRLFYTSQRSFETWQRCRKILNSRLLFAPLTYFPHQKLGQGHKSENNLKIQNCE